ncbi:MAG: PH domain-containing protein [Lachnospiraceae bacterium]|nr:PH domain-containing protein [Lachnospiraceae bacterium]
MEYKERKRILLFGLPWTFTKYAIRDDMINVKRGLLKTIEDDCYMYKVTDVKLETSFLERLAGVATVVCYTGDTTDHKLELVHIMHAKEIKEFILEHSEKERMKRRTINTQNLNGDFADGISDGDMDL